MINQIQCTTYPYLPIITYDCQLPTKNVSMNCLPKVSMSCLQLCRWIVSKTVSMSCLVDELSWFRAADLKLIFFFPVYLGCYAMLLHEHIIYIVYSDYVLVFAFAVLPCKKMKSALNRTFSTESYRNWRKSINILKNNGLFLKNKQKFERKRIMG